MLRHDSWSVAREASAAPAASFKRGIRNSAAKGDPPNASRSCLRQAVEGAGIGPAADDPFSDLAAGDIILYPRPIV